MMSSSAAKDSMSSQPTNSQTLGPTVPKKKKQHRGGKNRKKTKRTSTAPAAAGAHDGGVDLNARPTSWDAPSAQPASFYRLRSNRSDTSLESETLLDHREHIRQQRLNSHQSARGTATRGAQSAFARHRPSNASAMAQIPRSRLAQTSEADVLEDDDENASNERSPLLSTSRNWQKPDLSRKDSDHGYVGYSRARRSSVASRTSSRRQVPIDTTNAHTRPLADDEDYDVNNPPSVPGSPMLGSINEPIHPDFPPGGERGRDVLIDIDSSKRRKSSSSLDVHRRRATVADLAERDVCFPSEHPLSEIGEEELEERQSVRSAARARRRHRPWPDLEVLEDWSREEKEELAHQEHIRAKKISEPVMVGGRLRPAKLVWHRDEDEKPFRFTYFNENVEETVHARTISDLVQDGGGLRELFIPSPAELSDSSDDEDDHASEQILSAQVSMTGLNQRDSRAERNLISRLQSGSAAGELRSPSASKEYTRSSTPSGQNSSGESPTKKEKRYGPRPTWWLDVLQPTEMEMKVLAKTFHIHQLTIEDILMEEPREKVELFGNYYFVNYRSFEQDKEDDDYMEPVNFYIIAFKEGVLTFHHSMTPHPANVRRRIRLLNGWTRPNPDWISYAIIDDVTDAFAPLTSNIEKEVDDIDDEILYMHLLADDASRRDDKAGSSPEPEIKPKSKGIKSYVVGLWRKTPKPATQADMGAAKAEGERTAGESGGEMLRRVGECRKKVMGLLRLLGNKADVLKGFAKRCNEDWEVAPRHDIGMYLGDIQDHINTMTGNVQHYESLLSRAHSNYVAQINIRMNERAEQNADVLGKLTVLGTIVLPMNIITGMWGMNVWVPGQEYEGDLKWFFAITAGLLIFGVTCFYGARKLYGIV